jgi:hypothetical protein
MDHGANKIMSTAEMTLDEIRVRGYAALLRELGPIGYVRFLQQFERGHGDYAVERHDRLDHLTVDQVKALVAAVAEKS